MKVTATSLPGVLLIEPKVFQDPRGYFMESYHQTRYSESGLPPRFVQDNVSYSSKGILRGLHFQNPCPQGKLISVLQGEIFDVALDIRVGSPHFGKWTGVALNSENHHQLWVPEGFAHGFMVTSDKALVSYKCTELYAPQHELSILWNDPMIGIEWPKISPSLSGKDEKGLLLRDVPREKLFKY